MLPILPTPALAALVLLFVALLIGLPAFTWWETRRAYRRAAALLDSWTSPAEDDERQVRHGDEPHRNRGRQRPAVREQDRHDRHHDQAELEPVRPLLHPANITVREQGRA